MAYTIHTPADRCREVRNGFRCALADPHEGEHVLVHGKVRWPQEPGEAVARVEVLDSLRSIGYSMADLLARHDATEAMIEALVERVAALESAATAAAAASDTWDADSEEPPRDGRYVDTAGFEWTFQDDVWGYWHNEARHVGYTWARLVRAAANNPAVPAFPWKRVTS